jgi:hypothetical protein
VETFDAVIEEARGGGAFVAVPAEVDAALGGKGRIPVVASFDGVDYRGSVATMGGVRCLGMLKAIRDQLGKGPGDTVTVTLSPDPTERTVTVPDDLAAALADAGARTTFDRLSYTHQREYVTWIDEAKKPATRARRVAGTVERLTAG